MRTPIHAATRFPSPSPHETAFLSKVSLVLNLPTFVSAHADPRRYTIPLPFDETVFLSTVLLTPLLHDPALTTSDGNRHSHFNSCHSKPTGFNRSAPLFCHFSFRLRSSSSCVSTFICRRLPNMTRKLLFILLTNFHHLNFPFL